MNNEEHKNIKKYQLLTFAFVIIILTIIAYITYAYVSGSMNISNKANVNLGIADRPILSIVTSQELSFNPELPAYVDGPTEIVNETIGLNVILDSSFTDGNGIECSYDIVFKWDDDTDAYVKSSGVNKEFTQELSVDGYTSPEKNFGNYDANNPIDGIFSDFISNDGTKYSTNHYEIVVRFYRDLQDQSYHLGKKYSGTFDLDNIICYPREDVQEGEGLYLADYLAMNAVEGSITEEVDSIPTGASNVLADFGEYGIRYMGDNPENWILFNCEDPSEPSVDSCERWRIIGAIESGIHGVKGNLLVKIVKSELFNGIRFDGKNGVGSANIEGYNMYGSSDWRDSQLMMMMNPIDFLPDGYSTSTSWRYYDGAFVLDQNENVIFRSMGSYYYSSANAYAPNLVDKGRYAEMFHGEPDMDFSTNGLANADGMIETVKMRLLNELFDSIAGFNNSGFVPIGFVDEDFLEFDAPGDVWEGKVMLPTAADVLLSTTGTTGTDGKKRTVCYMDSSAEKWGSGNNGCSLSTWISRSGSTNTPANLVNMRLLNRISNESTLMFHSSGVIRAVGVNVAPLYNAPTLYVSRYAKITGGNGSYNDPFTIDDYPC